MGPLLAIALDLAVVGPRADDQCTVHAAAADLRVQVRPDEVAPFYVDLEAQELQVALPAERGRPSTVDVRGALLFRGAASEFTFVAARVVESASGLVRLGSESEGKAAELHARGGHAVGPFQLDSQIRTSAIEIPCGGLTLDSIHRKWPPVPKERSAGGLDWLPRGKRLTLREHPDAGAQVTLTLDEPDTIYFVQLAADGAWLRVEWSGGGGERVRGWVRRADLRPVPDEIGLHGFSTTSRCRGGCARGLGAGIGIYNGPAEVRGGAAVFAAEELRGRWATVRARARFEVTYHAGDAFVKVREVPGIEEGCGTIDHAFVARGDVTLPDGVAERIEASMPHVVIGK